MKRGKKKTRRLNRTQAENKRMAVLATELGVAGVEVLIEEFGFGQEEADAWLQKWVERAKQNREK